MPRPPYESDHVGVVTSWVPPDAGYSLTAPEFRAVRAALQAVAQPLNTARYDVRARGWVGRLLAEALELDVEDRAVKTQMRNRIDMWIEAGRLRIEKLHDPKQARAVDVVRWVDSGDES